METHSVEKAGGGLHLSFPVVVEGKGNESDDWLVLIDSIEVNTKTIR